VVRKQFLEVSFHEKEILMPANMVPINGKHVMLSRPFKVPASEMIGRQEQLNMILASWIAGGTSPPLSPLLIGEPGTGKNRLVYECAKLCKNELYIFQGHDDVTPEDFACAVRFSDDPDRKMDYILSPLATAMLEGGICFVDEIAKVRPRALALLASVLDERRYLDSTLLGERVYAHPGFRFIAATNTADTEDNILPDFIQSRLRPVIPVGYPSSEEIRKIIESRHGILEQDNQSVFDCFWRMWRGQCGDKPPSPRDVLAVFGLALNLSEFDRMKKNGGYDMNAAPAREGIEVQYVEQAFRQFALAKEIPS
jgi:MoxR-like ATPase